MGQEHKPAAKCCILSILILLSQVTIWPLLPQPQTFKISHFGKTNVKGKDNKQVGKFT
jgi:hypothetical protein